MLTGLYVKQLDLAVNTTSSEEMSIRMESSNG
jgi:hypothetical protein